MARVTKDTMIGDLLQIDQNVAPLLLNIGMNGYLQQDEGADRSA